MYENYGLRGRGRAPHVGIENRSSSISKLQRSRCSSPLQQPTKKAVMRHRERRRDIQRAENLVALSRP